MSDGAKLILQGIQPAIHNAAPVSNFLGGLGQMGRLQQMALQNELLNKQVGMASLREQMMQEQLNPERLSAQLQALQDQNTLRQQEIAKGKRIVEQELINEAARDAFTALSIDDPERRNAYIERRVESLASRNLDPSDTQAILDLPFDQQTDELKRQAAILTAGRTDKSVSQKEFEEMIKGLSKEDQERARRIRLGLDPRAVGSKEQTIATTEGLTEQVATSQADIKQAVEFAEKTGASRAKAIDTGFEQINKIGSNIQNIDKAISAIDEGASTGAIESRYFPSLREASIKLDQIQRELGLDVLNSATFGALSESELRLALETALPTGLEPEALKQYLVDKKASQEKLKAYYQRQIDFLDQGGTIAGFVRSEQRGMAQPSASQSSEFEGFKVIR